MIMTTVLRDEVVGIRFESFIRIIFECFVRWDYLVSIYIYFYTQLKSDSDHTSFLTLPTMYSVGLHTSRILIDTNINRHFSLTDTQELFVVDLFIVTYTQCDTDPASLTLLIEFFHHSAQLQYSAACVGFYCSVLAVLHRQRSGRYLRAQCQLRFCPRYGHETYPDPVAPHAKTLGSFRNCNHCIRDFT